MKACSYNIFEKGTFFLQMRADVSRQLRFPQYIASTNLQPDIVLWSQTEKAVLLIELTVPHEDLFDEVRERNRPKN